MSVGPGFFVVAGDQAVQDHESLAHATGGYNWFAGLLLGNQELRGRGEFQLGVIFVLVVELRSFGKATQRNSGLHATTADQFRTLRDFGKQPWVPAQPDRIVREDEASAAFDPLPQSLRGLRRHIIEFEKLRKHEYFDGRQMSRLDVINPNWSNALRFVESIIGSFGA